MIHGVKTSKKRKSLYKLISLRQSYGCLEFFSVEFKVFEISEVERYLLLKIVPNLEGMQQARILVDSGLVIWGNNAQTMSVLKQEKLSLMQSGVRYLDEAMPGIKTVVDKDMADMDILVEKGVKRFTSSLNSSRNIPKSSKKRTYQLKMMKVDDCPGMFLAKIWRPYNNSLGTDSESQVRMINLSQLISTKKLTQKLAARTQKALQKGSFQFRISRKIEFVGEFVKPGNTLKDSEDKLSKAADIIRVPSPSSINSKSLAESMRMALQLKKLASKEEQNFDYGEGIRTRRLVNGALRDVCEDGGEGDESFSDTSNSTDGFGKKRLFRSRKGHNRDNRSTLRSKNSSFGNKSAEYSVRKQMDAIISKKKTVTPISIFKTIIVLFGLSCMILSSFYAFVDMKKLEGLSELLNLEKNVIFITNILQMIQFRITEVCVLNQGINLLYGTDRAGKTEQLKMEAIEYLDVWAGRLTGVYDTIYNIKNDLPEFHDFMSERKNRSYEIQTGGKIKKYTGEQAVFQIISSINSLVGQKDSSRFTFDDRDVRFIVDNLRNGIHRASIGLLDTSYKVRKKLAEGVSYEIEQRYAILLYTSLAIGLLGYISIYWGYVKKEEAVETNYGFGDEYLKFLVVRSERFVTFIQNEEANVVNDGIQSLEDLMGYGHSQGGEAENLNQSVHNNGSIAGGAGGEAEKYTKSVKSKNFSRNRSGDTNFLNLKKRKKKGSLIQFFGFWQLFFVGMLTLNRFVCSFWFSDQNDVISFGTKVSNFIYELYILEGLPHVSKNYMLVSMIDPKTIIQKRSIFLMMKIYDNAHYDFNKKVFKMSREG